MPGVARALGIGVRGIRHARRVGGSAPTAVEEGGVDGERGELVPSHGRTMYKLSCVAPLL